MVPCLCDLFMNAPVTGACCRFMDTWFETSTPKDWTKAGHTLGVGCERGSKKSGRPVGSAKADAKQVASLRLHPDVLAALFVTGDGRQTRVNDALRASLQLTGRLDKDGLYEAKTTCPAFCYAGTGVEVCFFVVCCDA